MSNYIPCEKCDCLIGKGLRHCPYCGAYAETTDKSILSYPVVNHNKLRLRQLIPNITKLLVIANLIVIIVNLFVIFGQPFSLQKLWCVYPILSSALLYVALLNPLDNREFYWKEAVFDILASITFLILIDFFVDNGVSWSITYIIPWFLVAVTIIVGGMMIFRKSDVGNMILVLLILMLLSIINLVLGITLYDTVIKSYTIIWTFVSFLTCLFVSASFCLIKRNELVAMWKKTFHI